MAEIVKHDSPNWLYSETQHSIVKYSCSYNYNYSCSTPEYSYSTIQDRDITVTVH